MFGSILFGQIIATSHDLGPQNIAEEGKSPDFTKIEVGEMLSFGQIWLKKLVYNLLDTC